MAAEPIRPEGQGQILPHPAPGRKARHGTGLVLEKLGTPSLHSPRLGPLAVKSLLREEGGWRFS